MTTRRTFISALPILGVAAAAGDLRAAPAQCSVFTAARQKATSPDDALRMLQEGNARFVAGQTTNCDFMAQVKQTAAGQAPFAAIVGCIDSRVPPEFLFDQQIGDIFCARIAGNFVDIDILGSLEFATKVAGARLVVVMGHTECGAVKGAVDGVKLGNLTAMLKHFDPAIAASKGVPGEHNSKNKTYVQAVADANAKIGVQQIMTRSPVMRDLVKAKELRVVAAMTNIATGQVTFFS